MLSTFQQTTEKESCNYLSFAALSKDDNDNEVKISCVLMTVENGSNERNKSFDLQVFRYVNGTPLIDFSSNTFSCTLFQAVVDFRWDKFGQKLNVSPHANEAKLVHSPIDNFLKTQGTLSWKLTPLHHENFHTRHFKVRPETLIVIIDYLSNDGIRL